MYCVWNKIQDNFIFKTKGNRINTLPASDNMFCLLITLVCKHFGPRSGPTERRSWSGSKLFDTLIAMIGKVNFSKSGKRQQKSMQHCPECKELMHRNIDCYSHNPKKRPKPKIKLFSRHMQWKLIGVNMLISKALLTRLIKVLILSWQWITGPP